MGLKGFLLSSNFIDGGVTGISDAAGENSPLPLTILLPVVNPPFIAVAYRHGLAFAVRSVLASAARGAALIRSSRHARSRPDAVFGGIFIGAGIGFAVRRRRPHGTEIAALLISARRPLKVGDAILG